MRFCLRNILCLLCALYLSGAHWMLLQTAAWTGMLVSRVQTATVADAVRSTFDGDHPCGLCSVITEQRQDEQRQQPDAPVVKKADDFKVMAQSRLTVPEATVEATMVWPLLVCSAAVRTERPPTPPPNA